MATSRSNDDDPSIAGTIDPAPTPAEAAAIVAALDAHLVERRRERSEDTTDGWSPRRWEFVARLEHVGADPRRPPATAPRDGWAAAARVDRF